MSSTIQWAKEFYRYGFSGNSHLTCGPLIASCVFIASTVKSRNECKKECRVVESKAVAEAIEVDLSDRFQVQLPST